MMISARIVLDSEIKNCIRLTTLILKYPRYIHSEFMTHRVFSRNASSSRAIPIARSIEEIKKCPVEPIWVRNQPGMQADETLNDLEAAVAQVAWEDAQANAIKTAEFLSKSGVHKQIVNRILEPFSHIEVIVTATEWENFFNLRITPQAQQEICQLALAIKKARDDSWPIFTSHNEWHLPFVLQNEKDLPLSVQKKLSVARCARVSYLNHDKTTPSIDRDVELHDKLLESRHMSPFEHQATPDYSDSEFINNFRKWRQYRYEVDT